MTTSTCSPWATAADVCGSCNVEDIDEGVLDDCLQVASDVLYELSGRRWPGLCTETIRPCGLRAESCGCGAGPARCGCGGVSEVRLPGYPTVGIVDVTIDGETIDPARYRLDDQRFLIWQPDETDTGSRGAWPCCQRLDLAPGVEHTWTVTYEWGTAPPIGGVMAAASLGCELALACDPDAEGECRLPKRVTTVTRQGVSFALIDPLSLFAEGKTGIPEVDLWLGSLQQGAKTRRATVMLPGRHRRSRRVYGPDGS